MSILTFQDALDLMQAYVGGTTFSRTAADVKQAIRMALSGLYDERAWTYYRTTWQFNTPDAFSSATIAYSHSGGYVVSLDSGNFADRFRNVQRGAILADSLVADVDRFTTNTAIMDANLNWGVALATGTSYELFQDNYALPEGFRNVNVTVRGDNGDVLRYVPPEEFLYLRSVSGNTGDPLVYTFMADPKIPGRYALYLYPGPSSRTAYRVQYTRAYREPRVTGDETAATAGTVTVSAGSRYVTGASSSFSSTLHEGAVLRFGTASAAPTGLNGSNPFTEEHAIANVSSTTAMELRTTAVSAQSAVKYVISDPIDIPPDLKDAFIKRCRLEVAQLRPDTKKNEVPLAMAAYEESLRKAKAADGKEHSIRVTGGLPYYYDLSAVPTGEDAE